MICAEKALILDGNAPIWLYISPVKYIGAGRKWGERLGNDWETIGKCGCEGCPLKGKINRENAGDFNGGCRVRKMPLKEKKSGGGQARGNGGKIAEIEFFEFENHAENGHLSADKRTKSSDNMLVLNQTLTEFDNV